MAEEKRKILVIVEGAKTDVYLMEKLLSVYQIDSHYQIVSYKTNIYTLYKEIFEDNDPSDIDLLQLMKSREPDPEKKQVFNERYSDILLIFDLDPHDPLFTPNKIIRMAEYFIESSDMGKLYINYPMVEAFYHMASIPDLNYNFYYVTLDELKDRKYKERVNRENRNHSYNKFAVTKDDCSVVIRQNISKAWYLIGTDTMGRLLPEQAEILASELDLIDKVKRVAVLSTCVFFIPDYNPKLIQ